MKILIFSLLILIPLLASSQTRWKIAADGSINWAVRNDVPHSDHIEMSGEQVSAVYRYGVNQDSSFSIERSVIWPMLRTIPNNTHASLNVRSGVNFISLLVVNGTSLKNEKVRSLSLNGVLTVTSDFRLPASVTVTRKLFPSTTLPLIVESYILKNNSSKPITVLIPESRSLYNTDPAKGVDGSYTIEAGLLRKGYFTLSPGNSLTFDAYIQAYKPASGAVTFNPEKELEARKEFISKMWNSLVLETPDSSINRMFAFAKIRGSESIYRSSGGLMHGPGGEAYYAAIWANDQAEYIGPFFPYLGYSTGNEASLNAYLHFARFMNPDYKPIPSSIIAEGKDIWNGAGDRGDAAMIAYGAARYALTRGNSDEAFKLWPLIEWCLEYCNRKLNSAGVVESDSDELEGRFPSGKANLCTSTLYYDALISAGFLGKELNIPKSKLDAYDNQSKALKASINSYFGATVKGFETYRYYDGCTLLRSWICMPLVVGIHERAKGTIDALFSPALWTKNGLLTQEGSSTFWDRSTLYALRGVYTAGETEKATAYLSYYSNFRLLGDHVPYAIEAWPEGSQRHLSAESGLYCRIITEGLFGIRPTGLKSCKITPRLPAAWQTMSLRNIHAFNTTFNVTVSRENDKIRVIVTGQQNKNLVNRLVSPGQVVSVLL